jgi:hypothetical protein
LAYEHQCHVALTEALKSGMLSLINPVPRAEPFDHGDWIFELKFDGCRAAADTVRGRVISRHGNRMQRLEGVLDRLPKGCVFDDGQIVVLDDAGRALFDELLFGPPSDLCGLRPADGRRRGSAVAAAPRTQGNVGANWQARESWIALTNGRGPDLRCAAMARFRTLLRMG